MAKKIMVTLLIAPFAIYLVLLAYLYLGQRSLIYFPGRTQPVAIPSDFALNNGSVQLNGWVLNESADEAILYFGGNAEAIERNLPRFNALFEHKAVYLLAYRGYGNSEGTPTEANLYADALALYDYVEAHHGSVSVIGRSLGSSVATYVAAQRTPKKLVLITPFASLEGLAHSQFPIVPVGWLLKDKHLSASRVGQIKAPTLILYAGDDQLVPEWSTQELIASFPPEQVHITRIENASHNSISDSADYERDLQDFLLNTDSPLNMK